MTSRGIAAYALMGLAAVYLVAPVSWMLLLSIMSPVDALSVPPKWIPSSPTFQNYLAFVFPDDYRGIASDAVGAMPYALANSLVVGFCVAALNVVLGTMAAYSFARMQFRGSGLLMILYLASRMVPAVGIMIPLYVMMRQFGLINSLLSLIIVETAETLPFSIWLLAGYFRTIPREIEEAARVDRCTWLQATVKVFLPVATPCLVATGVFGFMSSWGSFLYPLLFTTGLSRTTFPVLVSNFASEAAIEYGLVAASGMIAIIPPFLLALWFQRWLVGGFAAGAVKG